MQHLKTINELFGFGKKPDDDIVKDILNKIDSSVEFKIEKIYDHQNEREAADDTRTNFDDSEQIQFILNEFNICILRNYITYLESDEYTYIISLDDTTLDVSKNLMKKLYNKCMKLHNDKIKIEKKRDSDNNFTKKDYRITNKLKK